MDNISEKMWNAFEHFLRFVVYKLFRQNYSENAWKNLIQFVKFGIVGLTNTIIGYLTYAVSLKVIRVMKIWSSVDIYIAQLVMFLLSVAWSFYWNNKIVFRQENGEKRNIIVALFKTYVTYAFTSLFLAEILLLLWVNVLGINEYIAPIINLIITVPLNFVIQKFWTFRSRS